jgi:hypothetical protein
MAVRLAPSDYYSTPPHVQVIATQVVSEAQRLKLPSAPTAVDLSEMITSISPEGHMGQASAIQVELVDENWQLVDSGFFGIVDDPRLLAPIDLNFPEGSRWWWRLSQYSAKSDFTITLTFYDRVVAELQKMLGPIVGYRLTETRAKFMKRCVDTTNQKRPKTFEHCPPIEFHCRQLDVVQPVQGLSPRQVAAASQVALPGNAKKTPGIATAASTALRVAGIPMTAGQSQVANTALAVADSLHAGAVATIALIYAGMGESLLGDAPNTFGTGPAYGVWQGQDPYWAQNPHDVAGQARCFLLGSNIKSGKYAGGLGYQAGGAIQASRTVGDPVAVANMVEANAAWNSGRVDSYGPHLGGTAQGSGEARAIVQAGGGGAGTLNVNDQVANYIFAIGSSSNPYEDFWTGMQRIASQVKWALYSDGQCIYFDSEATLARATLAAIIDVRDPIVASWSYDWENRNIATNLTIELFADWNMLRPGDCVQLTGFGPASVCSSVTDINGHPTPLPGRWLVADVQPADIGALSRTYTLIQPLMPIKEPRGSTTTANQGIGNYQGAGNAIPTVAKAMAAAQQVSNWSPSFKGAGTKPDGYQWGGGHSPGQLDDVKANCSHGLDCSGSSCWVLKQAGMYNQNFAQVSGDLAASWGQPGQGKQMTVWACSEHVFIEFHPPAGKHMQCNTECNPWFSPWGAPGSSHAASGAYTPRHWPGA